MISLRAMSRHAARLFVPARQAIFMTIRIARVEFVSSAQAFRPVCAIPSGKLLMEIS